MGHYSILSLNMNIYIHSISCDYYFRGKISLNLSPCAAPFVEHLQKWKISIIKIQKKKIKRFFHIWLVFVTQGLRLNSIKIFCLTDRIMIKTYDISQNAPLLQTYKQATSFELYLKMLHFQKIPFKQLLWKKFSNKF